jgi:hypothetical protein
MVARHMCFRFDSGNIDISICDACGGAVRVIAETSDRSVKDPAVIKQILANLERKAESKEFNPLPESRDRHKGDYSGSRQG